MDEVDAFLAHHGVKGMKWGKKGAAAGGGGGGDTMTPGGHHGGGGGGGNLMTPGGHHSGNGHTKGVISKHGKKGQKVHLVKPRAGFLPSGIPKKTAVNTRKGQDQSKQHFHPGAIVTKHQNTPVKSIGLSTDAARALATQQKINEAGGTHAVSNQDLQHLVSRQTLEQQHSRLNPESISKGEVALNKVLKIGGNVASQQASKLASQGAEHLIKKYAFGAGK